MKNIALALAYTITVFTSSAPAADAPRRQVVTFADLPLASEDYWNGSDQSGGFKSRNVQFKNTYNAAWGSWAGFAYSRVNDTNTPGYGNQYAVWTPGTGVGGNGN